MKRFIITTIMTLPLVVFAQSTKPIEQLRREEDLRRAIEVIDEIDSRLNTLVKKREADCEMAIGYKPFCACILKELPVAWSFTDYIFITTRTKEENGYSKLDKEHKLAYEKVGGIRDMCVKTINAKP